ncbi:MAG: hypothetical protein ALECFALPRED_007632 [Alectoria fallacina]|uniref:Uncharacterized protein n=1 Tax=Alectoria fallacina TaxID=1903189 RepID=A0A8H3ET27_9LECA|nr:MAG: hypothetical protein ALECFALPRED_007632 [Alectoria fallacina]
MYAQHRSGHGRMIIEKYTCSPAWLVGHWRAGGHENAMVLSTTWKRRFGRLWISLEGTTVGPVPVALGDVVRMLTAALTREPGKRHVGEGADPKTGTEKKMAETMGGN